MNIILNVSGTNFEVSDNILLKIPYFRDMFDACTNNNAVVFVARSPNIFKHVIGLIIDPLYPFPKKYAFELDFYGIDYNKEKLYDVNQDVAEKISKLHHIVNDINEDIVAKISKVHNMVDCISDETKAELKSIGNSIDRLYI